MRAKSTLSLLLCAVVLIASCATWAEESTPQRMNMQFKDTPLTDVLEALLKDTGISYTIDPEVGRITVTAALRDVELHSALATVAKAAGIGFRIDNGTYCFARPRTFERADPQSGAPVGGVVLVIQLRHVSAGEVVPLLQMDERLQVAISGPSSVVIRGDEEALEKAKHMLRLLDSPDSLLRVIRVMVVAKVTVQPAGKTAKSYEWSTESVGTEGANMPLQIFSSVPRPLNPTGEDWSRSPQECNLTLDLVPSVGNDELITLTGRGFVTGKLPVSFTKSFDVTVSTPPGQWVVLAKGSATVDEGKVEFEVSAIATMEQNRARRPVGPPPGVGWPEGALGPFGSQPRPPMPVAPLSDAPVRSVGDPSLPSIQPPAEPARPRPAPSVGRPAVKKPAAK